MTQPTVLIVDDNLLFLAVLADGLARSGALYRVLAASNGVEALDYVRAQRVDLIVSDLTMHEMGGLELLTAVASLRRPIGVIVMTANATPDIEARARALGAIHFLEKPIDYGQLVKLIDKHLASAVQGAMQGLSLPSMLQLLAAERKSGSVLVRSPEGKGVFFIDQGALIEARAGHRSGLEAAFEMLSWPGVQLHLSATTEPVTPAISGRLDWVLMEAARLADEKQHLAPQTEAPARTPRPQTQRREALRAAWVHNALAIGMQIPGFLGVALVDHATGTCVGVAGGSAVDLELMAISHAPSVVGHLGTLQTLAREAALEDIQISLSHQYHLLRILPGTSLFLCLILQRPEANLVLARFRLADIERALAVEKPGREAPAEAPGGDSASDRQGP